jgi:spore germination protein
MLSKNIDDNIAVVDDSFSDWGDIVKRRLYIGENKDRAIFVCYIDDLASREQVEETVLHGLVVDIRLTKPDISDCKLSTLLDGAVTTADIKCVNSLYEAMDEVMAGNAMLLVDGFDEAVIISAKGFPKRGVEKPENEVAVQGPKEAFAESVRINTVLIRRRIRAADLKCRQLKIGKKSKTDVAVMYMKDRVRPDVLSEAVRRLEAINIDAVLDSGYVEQYIEDDKRSPFPQMQLTERPDKAAAELLEGRVAIVVDNSPFVILVPAVLASFYQASEDYYQRWEIMSFVRIIRYIAGFFAFALPGLYAAVTLYQPSMIAGELAFKLAGARTTVPIPTIAELIFMELAFEALREAGIRLPSAIGSTLGIVGGIIIGQAAVDAGLVSPMVVIVVALTGICSFAVPNISLTSAYRLIKYFIILLSAMLGLYGWFIGIIAVLVHLCSLKSFGIPYIYPFASASNISELKDSFIRAPLRKMTYSIFSRKRGDSDE